VTFKAQHWQAKLTKTCLYLGGSHNAGFALNFG